MAKLHYELRNSTDGEKYNHVSPNVIELLKETIDKFGSLDYIDIAVINNEKLKVPMKVNKVNDMYRFITDFELVLEINEDFMNLLEDYAPIIIEQEFSKVESHEGKIKIAKHNLITNSSLITKYGSKEVVKINNIIPLVSKNLDDFKHNPSLVEDAINQEANYLDDTLDKETAEPYI